MELDNSNFLTKILCNTEIENNSDPICLMESIRIGFPFSVFEAVQEEIALSQKQLSEILGMSTRTITRRKVEKLLTPVESDRLYRIVRVFSFTIDVLGDIEKARGWLTTPNLELGSNLPIQLLDTDIGVMLVEDVLKRIRYGIYG